jgi:hypothetical protein
MSDFRKWIRRMAVRKTPVFVGFNAPFDWSFVNWYYHRFTGENPFGISSLDIKSFFMGQTGCSWANTKSSKLPKEYAGILRHTHNALEDAIDQAKVFGRMLSASRLKNR